MANNDLRNKLFEVNRCGRQLASSMGFKDIFEAERIVSQNPLSFNRVHIGLKERELASLKLDLNELRHRYDTLLETKEKAAAMYKDDYKRWGDYKKWVRDHGILEKKRKKRGTTGVESRGLSSQRSQKNSVPELREKEDFQLMRIGMCPSYTSVPQGLTILEVPPYITSQKISATAHCNKENKSPSLISFESDTAGTFVSCIDPPGPNPAQCVMGICI